MAMPNDLLDFGKLDAGTQFKIYDRFKAEMEKMTKDQIENKPMETVALIIFEETETALAENAGDCEECQGPAESMDWQPWDNVFICGDCGHTQ